MADVPLCQSFWQADAVFAGEVLAFEKLKPDQIFSRRVARIRVDRVWRGEVSATIDVTTGAGGGDCGYSFQRGKQHLVYAYRGNDGSLTTSICSPTKLLNKAAADLAYLEETDAPSSGGRIYGTAYFETKGPSLKPAKGVTITLASDAPPRSTVTKDDGTFEFRDLPAGEYRVHMEGMSTVPSKVKIVDPRACAVVNLWTSQPGRRDDAVPRAPR